MSDKTRTIFRVMTDLNYPIMVKGQVGDHIFTPQLKANYKYIDSFLRSGVLGTTERAKFILSHYGANRVTETNLWNFKVTNESEQLSINAIRIQETRLNKVFVEIFGTPEIIESAFYNEDLDTLSEVIDKMRVMTEGDTLFETCFTQELLSEFIKQGLWQKDFNFSLAECTNELDFLARISTQNITQMEKELNVDRNKLAFVLNVLNQPMLKSNNTGFNKNKFDLLVLLNKNMTSTEQIERTYETQKFLQDNGLDKQSNDYETLYKDLLVKYNELSSKLKLQEEQSAEMGTTATLVSPLFSEDVALPNAIIDLLNDIASDYSDDKVLRLDEAKEFSDTLFSLSKYSMPIIGRDLASMNEKMLYCIWAALNNQLKVDGVSDTEIQNLIAEFKELISQRVSLLGESNYIEKVQKLLDKIKVENKEESTNGE